MKSHQQFEKISVTVSWDIFKREDVTILCMLFGGRIARRRSVFGAHWISVRCDVMSLAFNQVDHFYIFFALHRVCLGMSDRRKCDGTNPINPIW